MISEYLQKYNIESVSDGYQSYYASGLVAPIPRTLHPEATSVCVSGGGCPTPAPVDPSTGLKIIRSTTVVTTFTSGYTTYSGTGFYDVPFGPSRGPTFKWNNLVTNCPSDTAGAAAWAYAAANYILKNAGSLASTIVTAARNAIAQWSGTGLGVAAAAEFISAIMAAALGLSLSEVILILGGIGLGALLAFAIFKCVVV